MQPKSHTPVATVRVLVRNLESDTQRLQFSDFYIEEIAHHRDWLVAKEFFPEAAQGEWILVREYTSIPPVAENWSGFGAIPNEIEDQLVLLRLFRPGDLTFTALHVTTPTSRSRQYPYRGISPLVSNYSTRQYVLREAECAGWERFAHPLLASQQWSSVWFSVSRRFLLYGGGKEFNANFESDIDRVIDYITALEAALVPESDFVSRRLRERAERLLGLRGSTDPSAKKLLNQIYAIRSTLVHGSTLGADQMVLLRDKDRWWQFEELVRDVLVEALRRVPCDDVDRRSYLASLYDLSDTERADQLRQSYKAIKDGAIRRTLIRDLASDP
jgi:hypothetical protein